MCILCQGSRIECHGCESVERPCPIIELPPSRAKHCAHGLEKMASGRVRLCRVYLSVLATKFSKCDSPAVRATASFPLKLGVLWSEGRLLRGRGLKRVGLGCRSAIDRCPLTGATIKLPSRQDRILPVGANILIHGSTIADTLARYRVGIRQLVILTAV